MKAAMPDCISDGPGCIDFRPSGGTGSRGGKAGEAVRFLAAAARAARAAGRDTLSSAELFSVANEIALQVILHFLVSRALYPGISCASLAAPPYYQGGVHPE
jgi:hypothetical protein